MNDLESYFTIFKELTGGLALFDKDIFTEFMKDDFTKDMVDTVILQPTVSRQEIVAFFKEHPNASEQILIDHFGESIVLDIYKIGLDNILKEL